MIDYVSPDLPASSCDYVILSDRKKYIMYDVKRVRYWIYLTVFVFLVGIVYLGYFCPAKICAFTNSPLVSVALPQANNTETKPGASYYCNTTNSRDDIRRYLRGEVLYPNFTAEVLSREYVFDMDQDRDVLVFLHMQKTGGTTFGRHLVKDMKLAKPCVCYRGQKRCDCLNANGHVWLFSRYSTGWRCGLHADWTELTSCVDDMLNHIEETTRFRRFLYITFLREPYYRYVSEYKHVRRGATWMAARLQCNGRQATLEEVPFCFDDVDWSGVTLDEFMSCPHNLANNRQTRMLANLSLSGCYADSPLTKTERDCIMLNSAKENLGKMAFFGLTEYQVETQYLFERTFGLEFTEDFFQYNHTHATDVIVSEAQKKRILQLNRLDVELYDYAKKLFFLRLSAAREEDAAKHDITPSNIKRRLSGNRSNDYEEGDENFADDDSLINHRLVKKLRHPGDPASRIIHRNKRIIVSS